MKLKFVFVASGLLLALQVQAGSGVLASSSKAGPCPATRAGHGLFSL